MVRHKQNEMVETQSKRLKVKSSARKIIRLIDVQGCAMWEPKVLNHLAWKFVRCKSNNGKFRLSVLKIYTNIIKKLIVFL